MVQGVRRLVFTTPPGNLTATERALSLIAGVGLTLAALQRGGLLRRAALSASGASLISRGTAGYCGVKAALGGEISLRNGLREQWQRVRAQLGSGVGAIDSLQSLYMQEVQELASSIARFHQLLGELPHAAQGAELRGKLESWVADTGERLQELEHVLGRSGAVPGAHRDQAMQALIEETRKMAQICNGAVRDTALIDSLQRLLHYQIATLGSVAAYAGALGRTEEAGRFAEYADRDRLLDTALTDLARRLLSSDAPPPESRSSRAGPEARTH